MSRIILIRPGATDFDTQGRIQGTLDIPLSAEGRAQAQQLAENLRSENISAIYASCSQTAVETAELLAEAWQLKVKRLDKCQNLDHGLWQGMLVEDVKRKQPKVYRQWHEHPENVCPPEGEMLVDARERIALSLTKLVKKHRGDTIAIVLPEPLACLAANQLANCDLGSLWKGQSICGSWEAIQFDASGQVVAEESKKNAGTWRGVSIKAG